METDLQLDKMRLEVKNEITTGINNTPMALLFHSTGRIVQKITRHQKPFSLLFCVAVIALTILILLGMDFLILFRDTERLTGIGLVSAISITEIVLLTVVLTYFNINGALMSIRDALVDFIMSSKDLSNLQQWLLLGWSPNIIRRFFFWWTSLTVGSMTLGLFVVLPKGSFVFGLLIPSLIFTFLGGIAIYYAPLMLLLPISLRFYQFKLYENDPARSGVIEDISSILNRYIYVYVFLIGVTQLGFATINLPTIVEIIFMITFGWIPVITQYLVNQVCIRSIISRSKRKTLNRIQEDIQVLHAGNPKDKETMETINRLMDYHERIRVTPNSNLNIQSFGNFLNQLALPLLGFLLANIDKIIDFFR